MTETLFPKYSKGDMEKVKTWEIKYYDNMGYEVAVRLYARTKQSLLNKFRCEFGYYTIIDIKEIEQ